MTALPNVVASFPLKNNRMRTWRLRIVLVLSFATVLLAGTVYYAPRFLVCADKPVQSDAIVLFVGPDDIARQKEAHLLLNEGYARFLIVPAYHEVFIRGNIAVHAGASGNEEFREGKGYPGFYEKTHIEALEAKKTMDAMGLKSAAMVSSPYHMRRIRMISKTVFGEQSRRFSYVPGHTCRTPVALQNLRPADWIFVIQEYIKICWFCLYSPFISSPLNHMSA